MVTEYDSDAKSIAEFEKEGGWQGENCEEDCAEIEKLKLNFSEKNKKRGTKKCR